MAAATIIVAARMQKSDIVGGQKTCSSPFVNNVGKGFMIETMVVLDTIGRMM